MSGAIFGFGVGLFADLALVQTVGLSSLLYLAVGYWAGRARELRDPQGALVPIAAGAAATAVATVGYSIMQLLLGVDAPVTFGLVREILATILLNAVIATPVMAARPPAPRPRAARGPAPPPAARLHDGRAVPAEAGVTAARAGRPRTGAPRSARRWRCACRARLRGLRDLRRHLLPPLVPAGPLGRPVPGPGARQPDARPSASPPRAAQIVDRHGSVLVENEVATVVQLDPEKLPEAERTNALTWGQQVTRWSHAPRRSRGVRPAMPAIADAAAAPPVPAPGRPARARRADDPRPRSIRSLVLASYSRVTLRTGVPASVRDYLLERQERFPGLHVERTYLRRYPQHELAAQLLGTVGEIDPGELGLRRFKGVVRGQIVGKDGIEKTYDRYLRGTRRPVAHRRRRAGPAQAPVRGHEAPAGPHRAAVARRRPAEGRPAGAAEGDRRARPAWPGRSSRSTRATAACWPWARSRRFDPSILSRPITKRRYDQELGQAAGSPNFNRAIAGAYPTGSTFKPITSLAGLSAGLITPASTINDPGSSGSAAASGRTPSGRSNGSVNLPKASRCPPTSTSTSWARTSTRSGASRCRSGRAGSASGTRPASTCRARSAARSRTAAGARGGPRSSARAGASSTSRSAPPARWPPPAGAASPTCARGRRATT